MFCIYESKHLNEKELNESKTIIVNEWKQYILKFVDDKNDFTFTNKNYIESNFDNKSIVINENTQKLNSYFFSFLVVEIFFKVGSHHCDLFILLFFLSVHYYY